MSQNGEKLEIVQKYYIRKKDGEIDYEHSYDYLKETNQKGIYYVRSGEKIGYMNEEGEFIIPLSYDYTRKNYEGEKRYSNYDWHYYDGKTLLARVYKNNGVGAVNSNGEEMIPCDFEDVDLFNVSENFIPIALPSEDNSKIVWGMYDVKNKKVSVIPQYAKIEREQNGYASFKKNGKWGLLHCATGNIVIPAIYLLDMDVVDNGIVRAFLGGTYDYGKNVVYANPDECHVLVVNGSEQAILVASSYDWIERSGPCVMKCRIGPNYNPKQEDSFKILKMPKYIAIIKNATYEAGYLLKENGQFVKEWKAGCTTINKLDHASYISGGSFSAITYDGKDIRVTIRMKLEILKRLSME